MSKNNDDNTVITDIWEKCCDLDEQIFINESPLEQKVRGGTFSQEDRNKIKIVVRKNLVEKLILPFIEKKIRSLEGGIANTRKGIKN